MTDKHKISYTVEEAIAALGIGRTQLYKEIKAGRLEVVKAGKRTLIPGEALLAWIGLLRDERDSGASRPRRVPLHV